MKIILKGPVAKPLILPSDPITQLFELHDNIRGYDILHNAAALGWLRTDLRKSDSMGILMYKIMRIHNPDYLESLFY